MTSSSKSERGRIAATVAVIAAGVVTLLLLGVAWRIRQTALEKRHADERPRYETFRRQWDQLTVVIETDAGVFSPSLQRARAGGDRIGDETRRDMVRHVQAFFAGTSTLNTRFSLEVDQVIDQFGLGHAMPYIAAVAMENLERPIPATFGRRVEIDDLMRGKAVKKWAGQIDSKRPGELRIVVHATYPAFLAAAARAGHSMSRAYFDPTRNEIGLFLDMKRFHHFYARLESDRSMRKLMIPAFISFAGTTFNDDSGHELAHAYQKQSGDRVYALPAIGEGEALVNGLTRNRSGIEQTLILNDAAVWIAGKHNPDRLHYRYRTLSTMGRPMAPSETLHLQQLREWKRRGQLIPLRDLLALTDEEFYAEPSAEVRKRYLQSWILCLTAIRQRDVEELLRRVVGAREIDPQALTALETKIGEAIDDPARLIVSKEKMWQDAEKMFQSDQNLAAMIYQWVFYADPKEYRALIYLGDAFFANLQYEPAMKYYELARQLAPGRPIPLSRVADVHAHCGRIEEALPLWRAAVAAQATDEDERACQRFSRERIAAAD